MTSSSTGTRGLTRMIRAIFRAFSANCGRSSRLAPSSRSRAGMPIVRLSRSTAAIARSAAPARRVRVCPRPAAAPRGRTLACALAGCTASRYGNSSAVAGPVRTVRRAAERILQRVHQGHADVRERQPGQRRAQRHRLAGRQVLRLLDRSRAGWLPISAIAFSARQSPSGCRPW